MSNIDTAKKSARVLKAFMKEHNIPLTHGLALEAIARLQGHRNWATFLTTAAAEAQLAPKWDEVKDWQSYVFFFYEDEDTLQEGLYFLPFGARFDQNDRYTPYGGIKIDDRIRTPEGFVLDENTVAYEVYSHVPSIGKYGLPWYANDDMATKFFREELLCAAIDRMTVNTHDTGDDSASQYWFEAKVSPSAARLLEAAEKA